MVYLLYTHFFNCCKFLTAPLHLLIAHLIYDGPEERVRPVLFVPHDANQQRIAQSLRQRKDEGREDLGGSPIVVNGREVAMPSGVGLGSTSNLLHVRERMKDCLVECEKGSLKGPSLLLSWDQTMVQTAQFLRPSG